MTNPQTGKFGEPWRIEGPFLKDNNGNVLAELSHITDGQCSRLVDGVNALAEVPNPSTLPALLEACERLDRETMDAGQRDLTQTSIAALHIMVNAIAKALRAVKPQQQEQRNIPPNIFENVQPAERGAE